MHSAGAGMAESPVVPPAQGLASLHVACTKAKALRFRQVLNGFPPGHHC